MVAPEYRPAVAEVIRPDWLAAEVGIDRRRLGVIATVKPEQMDCVQPLEAHPRPIPTVVDNDSVDRPSLPVEVGTLGCQGD